MATFNHISGAEPSTVTFKVATVTQVRNSTAKHQELLSLAGTESTLAVAAVLDAAPASTAWGLAVREVVPQSTQVAVSTASVQVSAFAGGLLSSGVAAGNSSALTVRNVWSSTHADQPVQATQSGTWNVGTVTSLSSLSTGHVTVDTGSIRVHQSTAADLQATVTQASTVWAVQQTNYSTTMQISSLAGPVITRSSAADMLVTVYQSSAAALQATVTQASTTWAVQQTNYSTTMQVSSLAGAVIVRSSAADALVTVYQSTASALLATVTIGTNLQSTSMPSSGSSGLVVRQVIDAITAFASTSALASTTLEIQSSGANLRTYVTAYTITSTNQTPAHWGFFSSNGTLLWPLTLAALSSGVAGANLAVSSPGYLFRTAGASDALNFKTAGSTVAGVQLGVSYFRAP